MTGAEPEDWLGEVGSADIKQVERAPGGALSDVGRAAAIDSTLGLLGLYFAAGDQELVDRQAGSRGEVNETDVLIAGLRLRVALAASNRLADIVTRIAARPTFRYQLRSVEQVGALSGALDVNRWATRPRGGGGELTYPVLEVQRGARTPENALARYALSWLRDELQRSLGASIASMPSIEYRSARRQRARLGQLLQLPIFDASEHGLREIRTQAALQRLLTQVRRRLQRREITHAEPYRELVQWMEESISGAPAVVAGDVNLALYDDRFDNKLFELWCLRLLGSEIASALNLPEPTVSRRWRAGEPAYTFENFAGRLDLYFQRSIPAASGDGRAATWSRADGRRLGGIPDIVVRAQPLGGTERLAVLDPKLRQRDRLPAEELYKVLGYLQNFNVDPAVGGVLIYTTEADPRPPDVFEDGRGGTLLACTLNPSATAEVNAAALAPAVAMVLKLIDAETTDRAEEAGPEPDEDSALEDVVEGTRRALMSWGTHHVAEIRPSQERIAALLGDERWDSLGNDVQIMVATADVVGHQLDPTADFSGPAIGMCAAIEHVIHARLVSDATHARPDLARQIRTFGSAIDAIGHAVEGRSGEAARAIRAHLDQTGIDTNTVQALLPDWRALNVTYRIPAAHRELVSREAWQGLYRLVVGSESLLARTLDGSSSRISSSNDGARL